MTAALVIGAGIAGPVAAMALQRVGVEATVLEAGPGPADDIGAFLTLQINGIDALRAIEADGTKVLTYTARASVYEAQGKTDLASVDLRKAAALPAKSAFDTLAQAEAKRRVERLTKQIPCGGGGARTGAGETCL